MATLTKDQLEQLAGQAYYIGQSADQLADQLNHEHAADLAEYSLIFAIALIYSVPIDDLEDGYLLEPPKPFNPDAYPNLDFQGLYLLKYLYDLNLDLQQKMLQVKQENEQILKRLTNEARVAAGQEPITDYPRSVFVASKVVLAPRPTHRTFPSGRKFAT